MTVVTARLRFAQGAEINQLRPREGLTPEDQLAS